MQFPKTEAKLHHLEDGLTLILLPDSSNPVVSVQAWVNTGSVHEQEWLGAGISHLLEHMVFKGTRSFDGDEMSRSVQAAGGQWNAYTSYDRTVYYIDGPAHSTETFLKVVGEMVFHPSLPESEYEREKDVIRREIEMGLDDPGRESHRLLFDTLYHSDPRRHPVIGHRHHFDRISHADLLAYHRSRYTPDQVTLCIVGQFDPEAVLAQAAELTRDLEFTPAKAIYLPKEAAQHGRRNAEAEFKIPNTKLTLAWRAPGLDAPESAALDLLAGLLGSGRSALLYRKHREQSGRALEITAWNYQSKDMDGLFAISAECHAEDRESLTREILQQLEALSLEEIERHLPRVKKRTLTSQFGILTTASGRANDLAKNWHETKNLDFTRDYLLRLETVNAEDVLAAARHFLCEDQLSVTALNPIGTPSLAQEQALTHTRAKPELITLDNGLRLILISDDRIPLLATELVMPGGLRAESPEQAGIGTLMASALLKGTATRSAEEIASCLEELGGSLSAFSGNNSFGLKASCLTEDLPTALELAADLLQNASFPEAALIREKASQRAALQQQATDPLQVAFLESRAALFAGSPYAQSRLGNENSLAPLDASTLRRHLERLTCPSNIVLALAGKFDRDQVVGDVTKHFGSLKPQAHAPIQPSPPSPIFGSEALHMPDKKQAVLTISYPSFDALHPQRTALELLVSYLSDMAGPLFTRIREELGLAYYVSLSPFVGIDTGGLTFYLGTSPEQLEIARSEMLAQIEKISQEGLTSDEFERARANHMASIALASQGNRAVAQAAALDTLLGLGPDHHLQAAQRIAQLSRDEVNQVARELLQGPSVIRTVTP